MSNKKVRKNTWDEGKKKEIWRRFILPLLSYKPEDMTLDRWLEDVIFQVDQRPIREYRAREGFHMPGLYLLAPHEKIQGMGKREFHRHDKFTVRIESEDKFTVQYSESKYGRDHLYELTLHEWNVIFSHLEAVE